MQTSSILRVFMLAAVAATALAAPQHQQSTMALAAADNSAHSVAQLIEPVRVSRVLHKKTDAPVADEAEEEEEDETTPEPSHKKHKKDAAGATAPAASAAATPAAEAPAATAAPAATTAAPPATQAPPPATTAPPPVATTAAPAATQAAAAATTTETKAPKKSHKKDAAAAPADVPAPTTKAVSDKKIDGDKNEGVIDGSSEGSAEIDKIDMRNQDQWVSVYNDPPLLVIKASLYAFIQYNDSAVCDSFNMTMNAVEQKPVGNDSFAYHVVTYINCTKNGVDETQGRFLLNFIPEGKRLLLTECGHREVGEIVNWLMIKEEVPECMTPGQRKKFLAQPMKHIHANNGTGSDVAPAVTNFLQRLEDMNVKEVAIAGSATVALVAVIVVLVVFVIRKRKAQKDLERTIAGAKAEHAVEDDNTVATEVTGTKERKGLMDSSKANPSEVEEGSFVNSPAVRV
jgi:chemotaxis protein histidine kinase CheA